MSRRTFLFVIPLAIALAVAGCKIKTINDFPPHPAQVRVMNLMTDAPSIDVTINGSPAFANVAFQSVTGYQNYDNASTSFSVSLSGSSQVLVSFSFPLAGEQPYVLLLYGTTTAPQLTLISEIANPPTNGNIQLSVFNAAQNNSSVDIYVNAPGTDITTVNPSFGSVTYGGTSFNLAFAPGTYQVQVTTAGTKTVIYDSGGSALTPNVALSFIMYSAGSGTLINAVVVQSRGPVTILNSIFARLKAVNAAIGVGPVNQLLGTLPVNVNVPFAGASSYSVIPKGTTTINYESSATPGATIASTPAIIAPATDTTSFVAGPAGAQQAFVLQDQNVPPAPGFDRLRFVNASYNANPVNVSVNGTQLASNIAFPNPSPYLQVSPATVTVTFTDAATGAVLASQANVVLTANQTSSIYLIGPAGAQGILVTQDN
jgi:hypothetical protein